MTKEKQYAVLPIDIHPSEAERFFNWQKSLVQNRKSNAKRLEADGRIKEIQHDGGNFYSNIYFTSIGSVIVLNAITNIKVHHNENNLEGTLSLLKELFGQGDYKLEVFE